jgi:hypothetical protein
MGSSIEFNHIMKLPGKELEGLSIGDLKRFLKVGDRFFSKLPILFVDNEWNAYGYGVIKQIVKTDVGEGYFTSGDFEILYLFDEHEKEIHSRSLKRFFHSDKKPLRGYQKNL